MSRLGVSGGHVLTKQLTAKISGFAERAFAVSLLLGQHAPGPPLDWGSLFAATARSFLPLPLAIAPRWTTRIFGCCCLEACHWRYGGPRNSPVHALWWRSPETQLSKKHWNISSYRLWQNYTDGTYIVLHGSNQGHSRGSWVFSYTRMITTSFLCIYASNYIILVATRSLTLYFRCGVKMQSVPKWIVWTWNERRVSQFKALLLSATGNPQIC